MIRYSQEQTVVFLFALHLKSEPLESALESLREIKSLAQTLGFKVAGQGTQSRDKPSPGSYAGLGKLESLKKIIEEHKVSLVIFDRELSPNQGRNLEKILDCMVWDRTQLILEIFAGHARTPESKDQVELARLQYMLPRLVGMWAHLDREKGGISASRGTGEKQINIDRRLIRQRISKLEKALRKVEKERATQSKKRDGCFKAGVVGYTNAGKTSLINHLIGTDLPAEDKLFATLESTTRILDQKSAPNILISDTVGFIRNLPHNLVASFRSTLSVVKEADLLLHVIDASRLDLEPHIETTEKTLKEIGAENIPRLLVLNKMDLIAERLDLLILKKKYPNSLFCSIFDPERLKALKDKIKEHFTSNFIDGSVLLPYQRAGRLSHIYRLAIVKGIKYLDKGIQIQYSASPANQNALEKYSAADLGRENLPEAAKLDVDCEDLKKL